MSGVSLFYLLLIVVCSWRAYRACQTAIGQLYSREESLEPIAENQPEPIAALNCQNDEGGPPFYDYYENGTRRVVWRGEDAYAEIHDLIHAI